MASYLTLKVQKMKRPGIIGPLLLITAGFILLAANLGFVSLSIRSILWNFWPVILILIGLDIIVRNTESRMHYILGVLFGLIIITGVIFLVFAGDVPGSKDGDTDAIKLKDKYPGGRLLVGSNMNGTDLEGRDFRGAVIIGVNMNNAYLHNADLGSSLIIGADMKQANLTGANLKDAILIGTNLDGANMCGADLEGVKFVGVETTGSTTCSDCSGGPC